MTESNKKPRLAFFGTPEFAVIILEELAEKGFLPTVIVTSPDAPRGRKLVLTSSEAKVWGETREIPVLTPKTLRDEAFREIMEWYHCDLYIVAAYGKLIPKTILYIPTACSMSIRRSYQNFVAPPPSSRPFSPMKLRPASRSCNSTPKWTTVRLSHSEN